MGKRFYVLPKKRKLVYEKEGETIRQMPENYCVAYKRGTAWVCDPDMACDKALAIKVFTRLFQYEYRYGTGTQLIQFLND